MPTPELKPEQKQLLEDLYYKEGFSYGRDRLWKKAREVAAEKNQNPPSRRQTSVWLSGQAVHQVMTQPQKQRGKPREIHKTVTHRPFEQLEADLIDVQSIEQKNKRYILTGIDPFSKFGLAIPLADKSESTVRQALLAIIKGIGDKGFKIGALRTDNGSEFTNKEFETELEKQNIKHITGKPYNPQSQGQVERFNRETKRQIKIARLQDKSWVNQISTIVKNYNNSWQRAIGDSPVNLIKRWHQDEHQVRRYLADKQKSGKPEHQHSPQFQKGDMVRVLLHWKPTEKKGENYSVERYKIIKVIRETDQPVQYMLEGLDRKFQQRELLLANTADNSDKLQQREVYEISNLLDDRKRDGQTELLVSWKGYSQADNTWEPLSRLKEDVPKLVKEYYRKQGKRVPRK